MTTEELAIAHQKTDDRSIRNEGRIKKLEEAHEVLQDLATSVAVMAEQIKTMNTNVGALATKVDKLEEKPANRWDSFIDKAFWAVAAAFIAYVLGSIGIV